LPPEMIKKDVQVIGQIASIPQYNDRSVSFNFRIEEVFFEDKEYHAPRFIRLQWYEKTPELKVGQTWKFHVRLKPPHSFASPGASDYSRHLFSQHIGATGYVHAKIAPQLLDTKIHWRDRVNQWRENLWHHLQETIGKEAQAGIIAALAIGERANITLPEWKILQATGTSHLVAISGLHVGLVAGLVLALMTQVWKWFPTLSERYPSAIVASICALFAAVIYAALAGFAVPTQRALIMLTLVMYGIIQRRNSARIYTLATAVVIVLLWDPLATLSISFWLSFVAVACIFYLIQGRQIYLHQVEQSRWYEWGYLQLSLSFILIPVTLWFFQQASLVSPLANAIAIPWVSFIVVPLTLIGSVMMYVWMPLAEIILQGATYSMQAVWYLLSWFAEWPYAIWQFTLANPWIFASISLGFIIVLLPRGMPGKWLGICGLLPLWFLHPAKPAPGEVWLDVLDVGQGLATLVRTAEHTLLFDTGDYFSERLDAGTAVILPFLRHQGIESIDTLIISHDNADHSGGAASILQNVAVKEVYAGDHWVTPYATVAPCHAGQEWEWDGVLFTMLHPNAADTWEGNNASCVLKISRGNYAALLTGDIERQAEKSLLLNQGENLRANVMVVPHHGSRTSSLAQFIKKVDPDYAIFPAGFLNRFRFPSKEVMKRYEQQGATALITATYGTIHVVFDAERLAIPRGFKQEYRRYWHTRGN
jgi:competence protein ComEC